MQDLAYELRRLSARNRDGSYATQANRSNMLSLMAKQLREEKYKDLRKANGLKGRHVNALVARWHREELSAGTIKNRLAVLRWWAEKVGKSAIIPRDNAQLNIADRKYVSDENKARELDREALGKVKDDNVKMSLELQEAFGLRREEAIKFQPAYADQGDRIKLKSSWTKGGKEREIPIRNEQQRAVLDRAHKLAGKGSLIPPNRSYVQQLKVYERHVKIAGMSKMHGLRHRYAQERYRELTGWKCPHQGGPKSKELTPDQKAKDAEIRLEISREMGHEREQITAVYLGR